jgi:hypothetical protein
MGMMTNEEIGKLEPLLEDYIDSAPKRRGRVAEAIMQKEKTPEETRIFCALILLHRGMSPARVAIQPKVDLPIDLVKRLAAALNATSIT